VTPNGLYVPARTDNERLLRAHHQPAQGRGHAVERGARSCAAVGWRRRAGRNEAAGVQNLFGYHPAGTPSEDQLEFERRAEELGIPHAYCHSWDQLAGQLAEWGVEPRR
jgi:hypothetical protein